MKDRIEQLLELAAAQLPEGWCVRVEAGMFWSGVHLLDESAIQVSFPVRFPGDIAAELENALVSQGITVPQPLGADA